MKILVESGVVSARNSGKWTYYSINEDGAQLAIKRLANLLTVTIISGTDENERCCE
jgi:ArsR family transcriptional regulator